VRCRLSVLAAALLTIAAAMVPGLAAANFEDPCQEPEAQHLLCPNLRIGPPAEIYVQYAGGRVLLRATSDVRSRGRGPMELRGTRNGFKSMRVNQRIYRAGGGHIDVRTGASLHFTDVGYAFGGSYWKVHELARFELRRAKPSGELGAIVRVGPKLNYCLRDLDRTQPSSLSPAYFHYPGCNQNPYQSHDVLGTSVGWSDIYPADYNQQYIDVSGLHGCYGFYMVADPKNHLRESNENDNASRVKIRLPSGGSC
jgi:Lysyl oxidase